MSFESATASLRARLESVEVPLRAALDEELPVVEALVTKTKTEKLISTAVSLAEDALLPPEARDILADILARLAASYRHPAPVEAPAACLDVAPEVPEVPADPETDHVAA